MPQNNVGRSKPLVMKQKRLAAIDIGTNSIRCIIVEANPAGKFRVLDDEKATVRLGEGLAKRGEILPTSRQRAMEALIRMKKIIDGYGVNAIEAVATSAVRKAVNGEAFIKDIADEVGINVSTITGEEEAELAALSVLNNFDMEGIRYAMLDIGGGSVEIVSALGSHIEEIYSLELGAVLLTERFLAQDPVSAKDYRKLRKHVRASLKNCFGGDELTISCLVGSGGTVTSIAAMVMAMRKEVYGSVHGYEVFRWEVVHLLAMLLRKDLQGRREVPGLNPDRADIIIAGVAVVDELMEFFGVNLLRINERGIREGLILKSLKKHDLLPEVMKPRTWRDAVHEFARSCHVEEEHSQQVARLSNVIFDAISPHFRLGEKERQMLEAACLLHDTGYFISYDSHHKHSYHLIRHAELFGFTPRERELIANIARYHRKSLPKKKHEGYGRLLTEDRLIVGRLAGILRLADGLDRRRNSQVQSLHCLLSETTFMIKLQGDEDLSVELFGGRMKGDLFESSFDRKLILSVQ
jgi:exopolyphosphatase/guanosine-5'-triphosphate,3'-diphosphate pyrophosphatase